MATFELSLRKTGKERRVLQQNWIFLFRFQVTTDPVELWASPSSRSRVEKEYFDSHFDPFYRNEQIIIRAKNLKGITHPTSLGNVTFGPAFNDTFLLEVLDLQEKIKAIGEGTDYAFENICFAPLRTDEDDASLDQCAVQSVWGYFQDSVDTFEETANDPENFTINYLDALLKCMS